MATKGRKTVVETTTETNDQDDAPATEEAAAASVARQAPLFLAQSAPELTWIAVYRDEPIDEGFLNVRLPPTATEFDIVRRWGGGTFRVQGRDASGKVANGAGMRTIRLAGVPIFDNPEAQRKYRRRLRQEERAELEMDEHDGPGGSAGGVPFYVPPPATPGPAAPSFMELITLLNGQQSAAQAQMLAMFQNQQQAQREQHDRDLAAQAERRQAERELANEARDRDREFFGQLLASRPPADAGAGATAMLLEGLKLGSQLGAQGGGDPVSTTIEHIPEILEAIRETAGAVRAESSGGKKKKAAAKNGAAEDDGTLTLGGPLGKKARGLVEAWKAAGKDPEVEMAKLIAGGGAAPATSKALVKKNGAPAKTTKTAKA